VHVLSNSPDVQAVQGSSVAYGGLAGAPPAVRSS
jgi:hypothetical protein